MNRPSVEASDLTTAGNFVPHATSPERKRQVKGVEGGGARGIAGKDWKNSETKYRVSDSREEGE